MLRSQSRSNRSGPYLWGVHVFLIVLVQFLAWPACAEPLTAISGGALQSETGLDFGYTNVQCPQGMVALGGGVDSDRRSMGLVAASAPHFGTGGSLRSQSLGTTSAPTGWYGAFHYEYENETDPFLYYKVAAVCVELSSAVTVIESFDLAADSTGTHWVACPNGTVALGGGVHPLSVRWQKVVSSGPYYDHGGDERLFTHFDHVQEGTWDAPIGWRVTVRNEVATSQADIRVAVVCADVEAESVINNILVPKGGGVEGATATCPEGSVVTGGGADSPEYSVETLVTNGPAFAGGTALADQASGEQAAPTGWRGAIRNDGPDFDLPVRPGVICVPEPTSTWCFAAMWLALLLLSSVRKADTHP